jgi:hypothetical protein
VPSHFRVNDVVYTVHVYLVADGRDELLVDHVSEQDIETEHNAYDDVNDQVEGLSLNIEVVNTPDTEPEVTRHVDACSEQEHKTDEVKLDASVVGQEFQQHTDVVHVWFILEVDFLEPIAIFVAFGSPARNLLL